MIRFFQIIIRGFLILLTPVAKRPIVIRKTCERFGPVFIKLGQFVSTRADQLAPELSQELNRLQDQVEVTDLAPISDAFRAKFKTFDIKPFSIASLAQVHLAELKTGELVVVKILRPNIQNQIQKDLRILKCLARVSLKFSQLARRVNLLSQLLEFEKVLFQELDLLTEAAHAEKLRDNFKSGERATWLAVPKVYWAYSDSNCLVLERFDGIKINDHMALKNHQINMPMLATRGVEIFFTQVFEDRFFHADMHPGNILVSKQNPNNPKYLGVDFGIMGHLTLIDRLYLAQCFLSFFKQDYVKLARLQIQHGWVPAETDLTRLEIALRRIAMPLHQQLFAQLEFSKVLACLCTLAQQFRMTLKPQFFLLQKTLVNVEGLGRQLAPDLDLWVTAKPFLERWWRAQRHPSAVLRAIQQWISQTVIELGVQGADIWPAIKTSLQRLSEFEKN